MAEKTPVPQSSSTGEYRNPASLGRRFLEWLELFDLAMTINGSEDAHKKGYLIPKHQRSKKKEDVSDTYAEVRKMLEDHLKT